MKKLLLSILLCGFTAHAADAILDTNTVQLVTVLNLADKVDIEKVKIPGVSTNWVFRLWGAEVKRVLGTKLQVGNGLPFTVVLTNNPTGWIAVWNNMKADAVAQRVIDKAADPTPPVVD